MFSNNVVTIMQRALWVAALCSCFSRHRRTSSCQAATISHHEHSQHQRQHHVENDEEMITVHGVRLPTTQKVVTSSNAIADARTNTTLLRLNGHGLRKFKVYGMSLDMYVAACYSSHELRHPDDVFGAWQNQNSNKNQNKNHHDNHPTQEGDDDKMILSLEFHFLQSVPQPRMRLAWSYQMDWHVDHDKNHNDDEDAKRRFQQDKQEFLNLLGGLDKHQRQSVQLHWKKPKIRTHTAASLDGATKIPEALLDCETIVLEQGQVKGRIRGAHFQRAFLSMWFGKKPVTEQLKTGLLMGSSSLGTVSSSLAR